MSERALPVQLLIFALVGIAATGTHYLVALLVHQRTGLNLYLASLAGYCSAVVISFAGHAFWTFQVKPQRRIFLRFLVVSASAFLVSEALLAASTGLSPAIALAVVVLVIPVLSFLFNKLWVYRKPASVPADE
jgi:putative flippase GtrA